MMDAKTEGMKELVELLNQASKAYYQQDTEIMSNLEYDALYDELVALEQETGLILSKSPTQHVGYEVISELPKERHPAPMLSLDKTKSVEDLATWLGDKTGVMSWKMVRMISCKIHGYNNRAVDEQQPLFFIIVRN